MLPGCQPGEENNTVVLCHRKGGGMGRKSDDEDALHGCFNCHSILDGAESRLQAITGHTYDEIFEAARKRTHVYRRSTGLLKEG